MSWFSDKDTRTLTQKVAGQFLSCGPMPNHVAIIMDGNRRYARQNKVEQIKGHEGGFSKLTEVLLWCNRFGIREVTVYAFSIENFKRPKEEVDQLFNLARAKFEKLLEESEKLKKQDICVRIIGNMPMLPLDLQKTMAKIMEITKNHKTYSLNVCVAYTSRDEMTNACKEICEGVKQGVLDISDINEELVEKCLYTNKSSPVDLLIRTSGEVRLSDFLLWQCNKSTLAFESSLWPEFSIWDFYSAIMKYQLNTKENINDIERLTSKHDDESEKANRVHTYLLTLNSKRDDAVLNLSKHQD